MTDCAILFRDELQAVYGPLDWLPEADGIIHRFRVPDDKAGSKNGWYVLFPDGVAAGAFGSWKTGQAYHWSSSGDELSPVEAEQMRQRIEQARRQREAEQHQRQQRAATHAQRWWNSAGPADPTHLYLARKHVGPYGLRQRGEELLVPLRLDGKLVNLQRIGPDGSKRFLWGGRITGCYSSLGAISPDRPLCVAEGWATAATLHQMTGHPVVAAMNAGNLQAVALALRARYGRQLELIVCGDDDRQTEGNPGRTAANAAAVAAGALVAFPVWPADAPDTLTDFNDLHCWSRTREHA